ncbi:MAG: hypothetical protein LKJ17_05435 [Oscillospiraceae bacterium]|jgi:hypothetical protein|nr:hypothetical protein [Oscillospiraceae bacterium]
MATKNKNKGAESYSADYRSSYPSGKRKTPQAQKRHSSAFVPKEKPQPSASAQKAKKQAPASKAKGKNTPAENASRKAKPSASPRRAGLESGTELDGFLPENENTDESLLSKWDDGMTVELPAQPQPKRRGRHRYGIFVGSLVLLLALVGVGFLATTIGTKIHSALTDDTQLRRYDQFLTVVVAQDPQPFASPDKANSDFVLNASLWQCMTSDSASSYTDYDDAGRTIVPLGDVADACHQLFGPDCQLQPKNPAEESFFEYDSQNAQFHVALYSLDSTYTPYTDSAKNQNGAVILRVGYVPPSDETRTQSGAETSSVAPKPVKYMEYEMRTDASTQKQYIYAVKELSE